jgi:hypothetical protein
VKSRFKNLNEEACFGTLVLGGDTILIVARSQSLSLATRPDSTDKAARCVSPLGSGRRDSQIGAVDLDVCGGTLEGEGVEAQGPELL